MSIAFVNSAVASTSGSPASSFSGSYTCGSGANRLLIVAVNFPAVFPDIPTVSTMTYNGVSMTFVTRTNSGSGNRPVELWYLLNPASGSNTLAGTFSETVAFGYDVIAADYTGVKQSGQPDSSAVSGAVTNTTITQSTTTVADNCWLFGVSNVVGHTAGSNTIIRTSGTADTAISLIDSNSAQTPAGSYSLTVTGSSTGPWCMAVASFSPVVNKIGPFPTHFNS